ncbi:unnamed protein product [Amoebophrya sp. A120]|nr:unnamed protein product [Amoebophrya sp. A120]|eukprot:GSA120T00023215001.1
MKRSVEIFTCGWRYTFFFSDKASPTGVETLAYTVEPFDMYNTPPPAAGTTRGSSSSVCGMNNNRNSCGSFPPELDFDANSDTLVRIYAPQFQFDYSRYLFFLRSDQVLQLVVKKPEMILNHANSSRASGKQILLDVANKKADHSHHDEEVFDAAPPRMQVEVLASVETRNRMYVKGMVVIDRNRRNGTGPRLRNLMFGYNLVDFEMRYRDRQESLSLQDQQEAVTLGWHALRDNKPAMSNLFEALLGHELCFELQVLSENVCEETKEICVAMKAAFAEKYGVNARPYCDEKTKAAIEKLQLLPQKVPLPLMRLLQNLFVSPERELETQNSAKLIKSRHVRHSQRDKTYRGLYSALQAAVESCVVAPEDDVIDDPIESRQNRLPQLHLRDGKHIQLSACVRGEERTEFWLSGFLKYPYLNRGYKLDEEKPWINNCPVFWACRDTRNVPHTNGRFEYFLYFDGHRYCIQAANKLHDVQAARQTYPLAELVTTDLPWWAPRTQWRELLGERLPTKKVEAKDFDAKPVEVTATAVLGGRQNAERTQKSSHRTTGSCTTQQHDSRFDVYVNWDCFLEVLEAEEEENFELNKDLACIQLAAASDFAKDVLQKVRDGLGKLRTIALAQHDWDEISKRAQDRLIKMFIPMDEQNKSRVAADEVHLAPEIININENKNKNRSTSTTSSCLEDPALILLQKSTLAKFRSTDVQQQLANFVAEQLARKKLWLDRGSNTDEEDDPDKMLLGDAVLRFFTALQCLKSKHSVHETEAIDQYLWSEECLGKSLYKDLRYTIGHSLVQSEQKYTTLTKFLATLLEREKLRLPPALADVAAGVKTTEELPLPTVLLHCINAAHFTSLLERKKGFGKEKRGLLDLDYGRRAGEKKDEEILNDVLLGASEPAANAGSLKTSTRSNSTSVRSNKLLGEPRGGAGPPAASASTSVVERRGEQKSARSCCPEHDGESNEGIVKGALELATKIKTTNHNASTWNYNAQAGTTVASYTEDAVQNSAQHQEVDSTRRRRTSSLEAAEKSILSSSVGTTPVKKRNASTAEEEKIKRDEQNESAAGSAGGAAASSSSKWLASVQNRMSNKRKRSLSSESEKSFQPKELSSALQTKVLGARKSSPKFTIEEGQSYPSAASESDREIKPVKEKKKVKYYDKSKKEKKKKKARKERKANSDGEKSDVLEEVSFDQRPGHLKLMKGVTLKEQRGKKIEEQREGGAQSKSTSATEGGAKAYPFFAGAAAAARTTTKSNVVLPKKISPRRQAQYDRDYQELLHLREQNRCENAGTRRLDEIYQEEKEARQRLELQKKEEEAQRRKAAQEEKLKKLRYVEKLQQSYQNNAGDGKINGLLLEEAGEARCISQRNPGMLTQRNPASLSQRIANPLLLTTPSPEVNAKNTTACSSTGVDFYRKFCRGAAVDLKPAKGKCILKPGPNGRR